MVTKREVVRQNIKIFVFMVVLIVTAGSFQVFLSRGEDPLYSSIDLVDEAVKSEFPGERGTVTGKMSEQLSSGVDVNVGRKRMGVPGVHKEATIAVMPNVDDRGEYYIYGMEGSRVAVYDSSVDDYVSVSPVLVEKVLELSQKDYENVKTLGEESKLSKRISAVAQ